MCTKHQYYFYCTTIACSICAAAGFPILDSSVDSDSVTFTKELVLSYALHLADMLRCEFLFIAVSINVNKSLYLINIEYVRSGALAQCDTSVITITSSI